MTAGGRAEGGTPAPEAVRREAQALRQSLAEHNHAYYVLGIEYHDEGHAGSCI